MKASTRFPLTLNGYQDAAKRTDGGNWLNNDEQFLCWGLGVAGEAGEVADEVKKVAFHGRPLDRDKIVKELGDVLWYVAAMASTLGVPLSVVAQRNIEKLNARYPDGFMPEASASRVDEGGTIG